MSVNVSFTIARLRVGVLVLASALFVVPGLVRATGQLRGPSPSPIRLSRGFELPPAKCHVTPLVELSAPPVLAVTPEPSHVSRRAFAVDEPIPDPPDDSAPDLQRGPPRLLLA